MPIETEPQSEEKGEIVFSPAIEKQIKNILDGEIGVIHEEQEKKETEIERLKTEVEIQKEMIQELQISLVEISEHFNKNRVLPDEMVFEKQEEDRA